MPWVDYWRGGRVFRDRDGSRVYFIRRQIRRKRYDLSTHCTSERAALEHLERFERDPEGYDPGTALAGEPIRLTVNLVRDYLRWCKEKGNSLDWLGKKKNYLAWWMEQIRAKDLRRVTLKDDLAPALRGLGGGRRHRIEVIKDLYAWLREEQHSLRSAEDPTLDLPVPQARPEQWTIPKTIPIADHRKVMKALESRWRPHLLVLAGTGWHVAELMRFAESGRIDRLPKTARRVNGAAAVLVCPRRKSGEMMRTAVSSAAELAARQVLKAGRFLKRPFYLAVAAACRDAKITKFEPGQYRHSVATWAIEKGDDPAAVAAFLGHRSPSTTRRFYATHAVVPKVRTLV